MKRYISTSGRSIKFLILVAITSFLIIFNLNSLPEETKSYARESATTTKVDRYKIVDTGQAKLFNNNVEILPPSKGQPFYGQDAQYRGMQPSYIDNVDGTITDRVTGLVWQKSDRVMTYKDAIEKVKNFNLANQSDWRIPSIKEAYSLILFSGIDPSGKDMRRLPRGAKPFINTEYFDFKYGSNGNRFIDTQILSATIYRGRTLGNNRTVFGVNMADGRIKGYPITNPRRGYKLLPYVLSGAILITARIILKIMVTRQLVT